MTEAGIAGWSVRRDVFVGRARPLADVEEALRDARAGRGSLALISGEAGMGKTRLAEEVATRASQHGMRVLWGRCPAGEGVPPFWPWVQVLRSYARERDPGTLLAGLPAAEDITRLAGSVDPEPAALPRLDPDQSRFRLYDGLAAFLRRAADADPTMVLLDDLHCADSATLAFLRFLSGELSSLRLLLLATFRPETTGENDPLGGILAEIHRDGLRIALESLSAPEVSELITATAGVAPAPEVASAIHVRSGGNPFFVKELAQLVRPDGTLPPGDFTGRSTIPASVREVIESRLAGLTSDCRTLLSTAAVAGQEFRLDVVALAAGFDGERARALVEEAITARLLVPAFRPAGRYAFGHALVREALYAGLSEPAAERTHLAVGLALEQTQDGAVDAPHGELAGHFLAALPSGDREKAIFYALRAAEEAKARSAFEVATDHLAGVVDLVAEDGRRLALLLELGEARHRAGDWEKASTTYLAAADLARSLGDPEGLARAALGLGTGLGGFEVRLFDQRQIDLLEEALAALPPGDSSLRAWLMARLSVALSFVGSEERRTDLAREAVEMARRAGDPAAEAYALSTYCDTIATPDHIDERLALTGEMVARAVEAGHRELELLARRFRVVSVFEVGDIPALDREIEAFARLAEALEHPISRWYVPLFRGARALIDGRFEEAERFARQAIDLGSRASSQNVLMLADFTQLTEIYRQAGRFDDLDRQYERLLETFPPMAAMMDWISLMRAPLGRDDAKARAELERLAAAGSLTAMMGGGMWIVLTTFLAEAAAAVRHRAAAAVLYQALEPFGRYLVICGIAGCTYGAVAHHLALLADVLNRDDTEQHFEEALEAHRRAGAIPYLAHTQREYAAMLLRRGAANDRERAAGLLEEAAGTYRRLGMEPYLAMAETLRAGGGLPGVVRSPGTVPVPGDEMSHPNLFRQEGRLWTVSYGGKTVRLRDAKGLADIARLLKDAGREVHVSDLLVASAGDDPGPRAAAAQRMDARGREEAGIGGQPGGTGEILDATARAAYRARLADLQEELDEAERLNDPERAARARTELDFIAGELASAYGLGGRVRVAGDPAERARKTVTRRIRRSIAVIEKDHPLLGRHLARSIRTGSFCSYHPEYPVDWSL